MNLRRLIVAAALSITGLGTAAAAEFVRGGWSTEAQYLGLTSFDAPARDLTVTSPNGLIGLRFSGVNLSVSGPTPLSGKHLEVETLSELLWAPDSTAFAITSSEGGAVGTWSVAVYRVRDGAIIEPAKAALKAFAREYPNCPHEYPNAGAAGWSKGSTFIHLVVEMPCHSSCADMCRFRGYVVNSASGQIVERLSESEVRKRWGFGKKVSVK